MIFDPVNNSGAAFFREQRAVLRRSESSGAFPEAAPPGMAYVPYQSWGEINSPEKAFASGTLFPALCFPFEEGGGR